MSAVRFKYLKAKNGSTEILDSGLRVIDVLGWYEVGEAPEAIASDFGIPLAAVFEALAYAHERGGELQMIRDRDAVALGRVRRQTDMLLGGRLDALTLGTPVP